MTKFIRLKTGFCLALILVCTLLPKPAHADDGDRPIRLYAIGQFSPIGTIYSLGAFMIDGRSTYGEQSIWGGELIHTTAGSSVKIDIDPVGRITLKNSATARLATSLTSREDGARQHLFVASLTDGEMAVRLQQDAAAYIESCGSAFTSSSGACFTIRVRDGQPLIDTSRGAVNIETLPPMTRFKGRAAQRGPGNIVVPAPETPIRVNANSTKVVVTLWTRLLPSTGSLTRPFSPRLVMFSNQTPQLQTPAANRRVRFEIDPAVGTITPIEKETSADGSVEVTLTAGPNKTSGTIFARVLPEPGDPQDTDYERYARQVVVAAPGLFRLRNQLLIGAAVATVITVIERPQKGPIQQQPPAVVIP